MPVSGLSGASNDARQPNSPSPPGRGGAGPSASLLVGHSPLAGMLPPRASHLARRRSRQNRKLFLNRPLDQVRADKAVRAPLSPFLESALGIAPGLSSLPDEPAVLQPDDATAASGVG